MVLRPKSSKRSLRIAPHTDDCGLGWCQSKDTINARCHEAPTSIVCPQSSEEPGSCYHDHLFCSCNGQRSVSQIASVLQQLSLD